MYVSVRHYRGSGDLDEVMRRVSREIVPLLRDRPGFRGYWACQGADGEVFSITLFDTALTAAKANGAVRAHVARHFANLLPELPDVYAGTVNLEAQAPEPGRVGFASVSVRRGVLPESAVTPRMAAELVPVLRGLPGFRSYYAARLDIDAAAGIGVTLWDSAAAGELGLVRTGEVIAARLGGLIPDPVARISGEVHVADRA